MAEVRGSESSLRFIFVGGAPRSGTTLLQKLLNRHSAIYGGPEFDMIPLLMPALLHLQKSAKNSRLAAYADAARAEKFARTTLVQLLEERAQKEGVSIISEKTPANVLYFKELMEIFPHAHFVEVQRNPLDVLASHKKVQEKLGRPFKQLKIMKHILRHLKAGAECQDQGNLYRLKYEKLVEQPEQELKALMQFLKLPFEASQLAEQHEADKKLQIDHQSTQAYYSPAKMNQKLGGQNINKWRKTLSFKEAKFAQYYFFRKHQLNG